MANEELKRLAAKTAITYVEENTIVGVGTGSTTNYFIDELAHIKHLIEGAVASSIATEQRLKSHGIPVIDLNSAPELPLYVDGADEINSLLQLIKGGGGALTREKIIASAARKFICIADESKMKHALGEFPLPIEVIPIARSFVARKIVLMGGDPVYRENFLTDNGNVILDIYNLKILEPVKLEQNLNNIPGVVTNGLFAARPADLVILGTKNGVKRITA